MPIQSKLLVKHLSAFITENKKEKIEQVIRNRTRYITVVLEDIFQPHNASAVIRTCDCFGIQDIHIIENKNEFKVNPDVALGASKWVDVFRSGSSSGSSSSDSSFFPISNTNFPSSSGSGTKECIKKLRDQGYRIIATAPHKEEWKNGRNGEWKNIEKVRRNCHNLEDFPLEKGKMALFFGTELNGLSDVVLKNADEFLKIPMYGFTESLNISVCVAICLHHLTFKLHGLELEWKLSDKEKNEIRLKWIMKIIKGKKV